MKRIHKRLISGAFGIIMGMMALPITSYAEDNDDMTETTSEVNIETSYQSDEIVTINVWSYTNEVTHIVQKYIDMHPDCGFRMNATIIPTMDGEYQIALDKALMKGGENAPDIYTAEASFVLKYSQGEAAAYAAPYKNLGIDVDAKIKQAEIAPYSVEIGTNKDGDVVGLGYQSTSGAFIYRRSIAKKVWGTDDPAVISKKIGGGTGNLDAFWTAAEQLKDKGYSIISGDGDLWHAVENSACEPWMTAGILSIDPKREAFLDYSKKLKDSGYHNDTQEWQDAWFDDMKDNGSKKVFGFFGPAWFINYTLAPNSGGNTVGEGTYGDWAVCESPMGFYWGGTWLFANRDVSDEKSDAVKTILEWITLDCTKNGFQYMWANGTFYRQGGTKDTVTSGKVMAMSDGRLDFLGGQNMFDIYIKANKQANGKNVSVYDDTINFSWRDRVREYSSGMKTKAKAIADFKSDINYIIGVDGFAQKPSSWYKQNNKWYYYDSNCVLQTGWQKISGKWYYFNPDGTMKTGWKQIAGKWYYFNPDGAMKTGWKQLAGKWYYFNPDGVMKIGWKQLAGKWYYFNPDGVMKTGWKQLDGKWYYFNPDGIMKTGWKQFDGIWYYFNPDGVMKTGWKQLAGKWYYFNPDGIMKIGWKKINDKWYYFEASGEMATDKWIGEIYYVKSDGVMATSEWVDDGKYYVDEEGKRVP